MGKKKATNVKGRGAYRRKSVTIRGVTYESLSDAARVLGVSKQAVSYARSKGSLDLVGLNPNLSASQLNSKPVEIEGVEFLSHKQAARALGVLNSDITSYSKVVRAAQAMHDELDVLG